MHERATSHIGAVLGLPADDVRQPSVGEALQLRVLVEVMVDAPAESATTRSKPTLVHSVGGLVVLLFVQVLNVFKPQGVTPYGWRKLQEERRRHEHRRAGVRL